ncbi:MAG: hypothetical protein ACI4RD_00345, partial [Kiritimatiellia bacterium]
PLVAEAKLTSVKVELEAEQQAPDMASSKKRHVYGVFEKVHFRMFPDDITASINISCEDNVIAITGDYFYCTPRGGHGQALLTTHSITYSVGFDILNPEICATNARANDIPEVQPVNGEAGHLILRMDMFVKPFYVAFRGLNIQEVPDNSQSCPHSGYYDDMAKGGPWSHIEGDNLAGRWNEVNALGFYGIDSAGRFSRYDPPLSSGMKVWAIPMAWSPLPNDAFRQMFDPNPTTQRFTLSADGTFRIEKSGHWAERTVDGVVVVDGNNVD